MLNPTLFLISLLRKLPHTRAFDRHLTDCAAYEAVDRIFDNTLPALKPSHVLRPALARRLYPGLAHLTLG